MWHLNTFPEAIKPVAWTVHFIPVSLPRTRPKWMLIKVRVSLKTKTTERCWDWSRKERKRQVMRMNVGVGRLTEGLCQLFHQETWRRWEQPLPTQKGFLHRNQMQCVGKANAPGTGDGPVGENPSRFCHLMEPCAWQPFFAWVEASLWHHTLPRLASPVRTIY